VAEGGIQDRLHLAVGFLLAARHGEAARAQEMDATAEWAQSGGDHRVARAGEEHAVETRGFAQRGRGIVSGMRALEPGEGLGEASAVRRRRPLDEKPPGERLEHAAHLIDALDGGAVEPRHRGAAMRDDGDEAFGLELAQRLAHERAAHPQHLAELTLDEPGALGQELLPDGDAQALHHAVAQRYRKAGDEEAGCAHDPCSRMKQYTVIQYDKSIRWGSGKT